LEFVKLLLITSLNRISSCLERFKRVFFHDKKLMLVYKENKLNKRFNQYYKFLEDLKNYKIITFKEYRKSVDEVSMEQILQRKKLVKSNYSDKLEDIPINKVD